MTREREKPPDDPEAAAIARRYALDPHPEGGWYREIHRSPVRTEGSPGASGGRCALTVIRFLLARGTFSAFHRLRSEETWTHLAGDPLEIVLLAEDVVRHRISSAGNGGEPIAVVPAGALQAARTLGAYTLVACHVAPGFEFADFEMPRRADLLRAYPRHGDLILRFTRGS